MGTGKVLAHLSEAEWREKKRPPVSHIWFSWGGLADHFASKVGFYQIKAGESHAPQISGRFPIQLGDPEQGFLDFTWTLEAFDPDTGAGLMAPRQGRSKSWEWMALPLIFTKPGPARLQFTCVTDEGCTYHALVKVQVEP